MKKCKYCKSEIDEEAIVCPVCKRNQNQRRNINMIIIIIGIAFILFIISLVGKDTEKIKDEMDEITEGSQESLEYWLGQ
jgi:hypothetical protein